MMEVGESWALFRRILGETHNSGREWSGVLLAVANFQTDGPNRATATQLQNDLAKRLCRWSVQNKTSLGIECAFVTGTFQTAPAAIEIYRATAVGTLLLEGIVLAGLAAHENGRICSVWIVEIQ